MRHSRDELLTELSENAGCAVCRAGARTDEHWLRAFVYEHHTDHGVITALVQSAGLCPTHSRMLLPYGAAKWVIPHVYAHIVQHILRARRLSAFRHARCPACVSRDRLQHSFLEAIVSRLNERAMASTYVGSGGFCAPHAMAALQSARGSCLSVIVDGLKKHLDSNGSADAAWLFASSCAARAPACPASEPALGEGAITDASTIERLAATFNSVQCPACAAVGMAGERYIIWLSDRIATRMNEVLADDVRLCGTHLGTLNAVNASAAMVMCEAVGSKLGAALTDASERLSLAATRFGWIRNKQERAALSRLANWRICSAHRIEQLAESRFLSLLSAALTDGPTAAQYESSHGLCLRHARQCGTGDAAPIVERVLRARLSVLYWELEEAARKAAWPARHEAPGPEGTAWLRIFAQLDGRVLPGYSASRVH